MERRPGNRRPVSTLSDHERVYSVSQPLVRVSAGNRKLSFPVTPCRWDTSGAVMQLVAMTACFFFILQFCKHELTSLRRRVLKWYLVFLHPNKLGKHFGKNIGWPFIFTSQGDI